MNFRMNYVKSYARINKNEVRKLFKNVLTYLFLFRSFYNIHEAQNRVIQENKYSNQTRFLLYCLNRKFLGPEKKFEVSTISKSKKFDCSGRVV